MLFLPKRRTKGDDNPETDPGAELENAFLYPSFVKEKGFDERGNLILIICGKKYVVYPFDTHIDEAINLASRWRPHQVTYDRIVHLRSWIRENHQHGHNLPYKDLESMKSCRHFVERVIHREFAPAKHLFVEGYRYCLKENTRIFSNHRKQG
ncbi:hypothetical protein [Chitinophaga agrisoli]|uniref:hypothetical protein n=1 Tax=Chitinophaga agrisoli TaxID=2607653 RepID=UPI001661D431|nr:hypothetical protein [Chitinophaga agrisoli]